MIRTQNYSPSIQPAGGTSKSFSSSVEDLTEGQSYPQDGHDGAAKVGDCDLMPSPVQLADVRWRMRVQEHAADTGHAWIEVDDGKGGTFSTGAYFGKGLQTPDPAVNDQANGVFKSDNFKTIKTYHTTREQDAQYIQFLQGKLKDSRANPGNYYKLGHVPGSGAPGTHSVSKSKVCTTTSANLLREGKVDPNANNTLLQPNDLYNHYHPNAKLPAGPIPMKVVP